MKFEKEAIEFLKKRSIQKDNLVISRSEAISGLSDFAELIIKKMIDDLNKV